MARAPKTAVVAPEEPPWEEPAKTRAPRAAKTSPGTAVVPWEEEAAKYALAEAEKEKNAGGGQSFSIQGGILTLNGQQVKNNRMAVIILDSMFANVYFSEKYDPQNPAPPTCFAFDHNEETLKPHKVVFDVQQAQNPQCRGCPQSQWGSAETGRGKACSNRRKLVVIPAGDLDDNNVFTSGKGKEFFTNSTMAILSLPVMSVGGYATFVKNVAATKQRPPQGIFTRVSVVPDPKSQFRVVFEAIDAIPQAVWEATRPRWEEARALNLVPFDMTPVEPKQQTTRGGRATNNGPAPRKSAPVGRQAGAIKF